MQGLFYKNIPQSLEKFSVLVDIQQLCVQIKFNQTWKNKNQSSIEGSYQFHLPRDFCLGGLKIKVKDKIIVGTIKEKEEAVNSYDDAISSGHSAFLVENTGANNYQLSVGNLAPNDVVEVELVLLTLLKNEKGKLKLVIPVELFPQKSDYDFVCNLNITQPVQSILCNLTGAKISEDFKTVTWQRTLHESSKPHPHPLIPYMRKTQQWTCDTEGGCPHGVTYFDIWPNITRFNCSQGCNYDLCDKCMGTFTHPWHEHPLSPIIDYTHRWRCDGQKTADGSRCPINYYDYHNNVARYRCTAGCDYDLCQQCMDVVNKISTDLVLMIDVVNLEPCAILETSPADSSSKSSAILVTHYPQWNNVNSDLIECKMELIFVVDRSGSMRPKWKDTVQAMNILIHALPNKALFNIIGFGGSFQSLFPKSVPYNDENLKIAENHCDRIQPDLGGTDLLEPLKYIFQLPLNGSYPRVIIVLTDGEVENRDFVISTIKHQRGTAKLFSIGLGEQVDRALVEGIASTGDGESTLVTSQEDIQKAILTLFSKTFEPSLKDVRVFWSENEISENSAEILQTPHLLTVTNGQRVVVFGLVNQKGNPDGISSVTISGIDPEGNLLKWNVPITMRREGMLVQRLAAASLIRDLEEKRSEYHFDKDGNAKFIPEDQLQEIKQNIKNKIISLSTTYQVASSHTSFQATVETDQPTETSLLKEPPIKLTTPILVTRPYNSREHSKRVNIMGRGSGVRGFGYYFNPVISCSGSRSRTRSRSRSRSPSPKTFGSCQNLQNPQLKRKRVVAKRRLRSTLESSKKRKTEDESDEKNFIFKNRSENSVQREKQCDRVLVTSGESSLMDLISKQTASGGWSLVDIAILMHKSTDDINQNNPGIIPEVWATALALAVLHVRYPDKTEMWRMVAHKARLYMVQQITTASGVGDKKAAYTAAKEIELKAIGIVNSLFPGK